MREILSNLARNPRTTAGGIVSLMVWVFTVWISANAIGLPEALLKAFSEPGMSMLLVAAYLGLVGKDGSTTGTAAKPNPSLVNVTVEQKPDPATVVIIKDPTPAADAPATKE